MYTPHHTHTLTLKKSLIAKCKKPAKTMMKKTAKRLPMMSLFLSYRAADTRLHVVSMSMYPSPHPIMSLMHQCHHVPLTPSYPPHPIMSPSPHQ